MVFLGGKSMKKCVVCGEDNSFICSNCTNNNNVNELIENIIFDYYNKDKEDVFMNNEMEIISILDIVEELVEYVEEPYKKIYTLLAMVGKTGNVYKVNRELLYKNKEYILGLDSKFESYKIKLVGALIGAYYMDYQYQDAEDIIIDLEIDKIKDYNVLMIIALFYTYTRVYEKSKDILEKAIKDCKDEDMMFEMEKQLDLSQKRFKGEVVDYLPASLENRKLYIKYLESKGIEITNPKQVEVVNGKEIEYLAIEIVEEAGFKNFVAFDFETTGFSYSYEEITEIGAIKVVNGEIVESKKFIFQELVYTNKFISDRVFEVTGINNEMLDNCRKIDVVIKDFKDFVGDDILVGFNSINFDYNFLVRASMKNGIIFNNKHFDVMNYVVDFQSQLNLTKKNLGAVSLALGIKNPQAHRALADAITTAKVYLALLEIDTK